MRSAADRSDRCRLAPNTCRLRRPNGRTGSGLPWSRVAIACCRLALDACEPPQVRSTLTHFSVIFMLLHPVSLSSRRAVCPAMPARDPLSRRAHWSVGQPISYLMHMALARPQLISLAAGFVDQQSLPLEATQAAIEAILRDPPAGRAALQYGTTHG